MVERAPSLPTFPDMSKASAQLDHIVTVLRTKDERASENPENPFFISYRQAEGLFYLPAVRSLVDSITRHPTRITGQKDGYKMATTISKDTGGIFLSTTVQRHPEGLLTISYARRPKGTNETISVEKVSVQKKTWATLQITPESYSLSLWETGKPLIEWAAGRKEDELGRKRQGLRLLKF